MYKYFQNAKQSEIVQIFQNAKQSEVYKYFQNAKLKSETVQILILKRIRSAQLL